MAIIELNNIGKVFRTREIETTALENVNLSVEKGEFLSIMGPSGCGKSTLLNITGLLDNPTSGTLRIMDTDCASLSDTARARFRNSNLGFVFQSFHLIPSLNVASNIELPLDYRSDSGSRSERVREVAERLGIAHRLKHLPSQLSGGQCQRVAIARAIVGRPSIILADEPTGNLDSKMGTEVMELLHELNRRDGITVVMVTHNEEQARRTDRIVRFFDGRIIN
jgi:putative ABC transport system ATP-binding protein